MNLFTSQHGATRLRQRLKTSKQKVDAEALEAIDKGMPREATGGKLRGYLDARYREYQGETKMFLWRNLLWIFSSEDRLITCYPMPGSFTSDIQIQRQKWEKRKADISLPLLKKR